MAPAHDAREWPGTRRMFRRAFRSSFHYSIASVAADGSPRVTPIASVLLTEPGRGIFFDIFTSQLSANLDRDPRVCVMAVDSSRRFWFASLRRGRFTETPALRLVGTAGPRRPATAMEQDRWLRRVRPTRRLKGHDLLWGELPVVRDLTFENTLPVRLGRMTGDEIPRPDVE